MQKSAMAAPLRRSTTLSSPGASTSKIVSALRWTTVGPFDEATQVHSYSAARQSRGPWPRRGGAYTSAESGVGQERSPSPGRTETRKRQGAKSDGSTHNVRNRV